MQVNALQFRNQMETFGSSNGDQMGPSAAESFLENFVRGGPRGGGGYPFKGKLGILNPSLIMILLP